MTSTTIYPGLEKLEKEYQAALIRGANSSAPFEFLEALPDLENSYQAKHIQAEHIQNHELPAFLDNML